MRSAQRCVTRGISMIEFAVVLVVLGMLTWTVSSAYLNSAQVRERDLAQQTAATLQQVIRAFALTNGRLPCPDTLGNGWENLTGSACTTGTDAGWFPYRSLGLDVPEPRLRALYAVYRNPATTSGDADLAIRTERTGDAAGAPTYQNTRDLIVGLNWASAAPLSATLARLTGNQTTEGNFDCTVNVRSNPAYWVLIPLSDRDNNGQLLDAIHTLGSPCAYAQDTPATFDHDDVVVAESLSSLAGWLAVRAP